MTLIAALILSCGLAACEPAATERDSSAAAGSKSKPTQDKKTCLAIVNGQETSSRPEVGFIFSLLPGQQTGACTGTFVSANTMITAAHCIMDGITPNYVPGSSFDLTRGELVDKWAAEAPKVKDVLVSELESSGNGSIRSDKGYKDIAIIIFEDDIAPAIMPLLGRSPSKGEEAELMGFGVTTALEAPSTGASVKRQGFNTIFKHDEIDQVYPDSILLVGAATTNGSEKALTGHGDSGGPLIVDNAIAGVCSNGGEATPQDKELFQEEALSAYADLSSVYARQFMKDAEDAGAVFTQFGDEIPEGVDSTEPGEDEDDEKELCE